MIISRLVSSAAYFDLRTCAMMANCAASLAIESVGATQGLTDKDKINARFEEFKKLSK